jgi:short-subunit dehydrogenase
MHLHNKTIWLTGASSGIGEALAYALAAEGAQLILTARRDSELQRVRAACRDPERHRVVPLDLSDASHLEAQAQQIIAEYGPIDVLINNAGIGQRATVLETDLSVQRRIMEVNYFSVVSLTRGCLPHLLSRPESMVVSISSVIGKVPTPRRSAYAASKHAVIAFMDSLRAETHHSALHCLTICPGYIRTPFSYAALLGDGRPQAQLDDGQKNGMAPEVCARAIVRAMQNNRAEAIIGGKETLGVYIKNWCPPLYRWMITKVRIT